MKRNFSLIEQLKKVPWWGWVAGIGSFALQTLFYYLSNWLANVTGSVVSAAPVNDLTTQPTKYVFDELVIAPFVINNPS